MINIPSSRHKSQQVRVTCERRGIAKPCCRQGTELRNVDPVTVWRGSDRPDTGTRALPVLRSNNDIYALAMFPSLCCWPLWQLLHVRVSRKSSWRCSAGTHACQIHIIVTLWQAMHELEVSYATSNTRFWSSACCAYQFAHCTKTSDSLPCQ